MDIFIILAKALTSSHHVPLRTTCWITFLQKLLYPFREISPPESIRAMQSVLRIIITMREQLAGFKRSKGQGSVNQGRVVFLLILKKIEF